MLKIYFDSRHLELEFYSIIAPLDLGDYLRFYGLIISLAV